MSREDRGSINGVDPTIEFGGVAAPFVIEAEVDEGSKRMYNKD